MLWGILKRKRLINQMKSKLVLSVFCFFIGYLFHYFIVYRTKEDKETLLHMPNHFRRYDSIDIFLVLLIFSSVNNFSKRQTIRETWLSNISKDQETKYYFIISLGGVKENQIIQIFNEQSKYKDLLIFPDLEDSFYSLTFKLVAALGWLTDIPVLEKQGISKIQKPFHSFKYVLKCDDDSFVRVSKIKYELKTVYSQTDEGLNLYWGFFDGRARVKKTGKYKEDEWNNCDYYTPYALGGGYVLAKPLVEFIAKNEKYLKKYKSEDVSVGAWLSNYSGVTRVHDPRFDTEYISRGCHQSYLVTHKHSETAMKNFYYNIKNSGNLCEKEYKTRMSYIYDWKALPSKCCARINPDIP